VILRLLVSSRETERIVNSRDEVVIDETTGLPSHRAVETWLAEIEPDPAVLAIDIHRFQTANTALGLRAGDTMLSAVATRLKRACGDPRRLGRIGSDGFVLIMGRSGDDALVEETVREILEAFDSPFWIEGLRV